LLPFVIRASSFGLLSSLVIRPSSFFLEGIMPTSYDRELHVALDAAAEAGRLIMDHYARFEVIPDAPASITTDTDRASQELILRQIRQAFPDDALCAEEQTPTLAGAPRNGARLWMVDPIDGTRGFARKNGEFAVMIAFLDRNRPAVGVVAEPARGRLTYAVKGGGCWRRDGGKGSAERCRVTATADLAAATLTQSHSRKGAPPSAELRALHPARLVETYSAGIKLALVARGEADLYLNSYDKCYDWDICSGHLLTEEAGGRVTSLTGEAPEYGRPGFMQRTGGLLATNGVLHEAAVAALGTVARG
jgi:3'(2'), 5'-bisphosphate nucleotidase